MCVLGGGVGGGGCGGVGVLVISMLCQRGQSPMKLHNSNYGAPYFRIMELPRCYRFMDFHNLIMVLHN